MLTTHELLTLFRRDHSFYDKGWVPGPNALWQHKSPDEMARSIHHGSKKESDTSSLLGREGTSKLLTPDKKQPPPLAKRVETAQRQDPLGTAPQPKNKLPNVGDSVSVKGVRAKVVAQGHNNVTVEMPDGTKQKVRFRDRENEPKVSLREIVKKNGGINLNSLESHGYDVKALMESGLQYRGLFRREGGADITDMAKQLHNEGHLLIPGESTEAYKDDKSYDPNATNASQYLLDQMLAKAKSLEASKEDEYTKSYKAFLQEKANAEASESEIAEAIRSGEADGEVEAGEGDSAFDDSQLAEEGDQSLEAGLEGDVGDFEPSKLGIKPFQPLGKKEELPKEEPKAEEPKDESKETTGEEKSPPDSMAMKRASDLFESLQGANTGQPASVVKGVKAAAKYVKQGSSDFDDLVQEANLAVINAFAKQVPDKPENFAFDIAFKSVKSGVRKATTKKAGEGKVKQAAEDMDVEAKGNKHSSPEEVRAAISQVKNPLHRQILDGLIDEKSMKEIGKELGMSMASVSREAAKARELLKEHSELYEKIGEKTRYFMEPVRPEVWEEILQQANQFGPMGATFIRSVMEAMKTCDSQYEAIIKGRQAFLSGEHYEYGPRHQPPKRIEGALARLEALMEYADDIDEETLESEVEGIAREFSADDLKEIARKFGVKRGLATKMIAMEKILAKVCEGVS